MAKLIKITIGMLLLTVLVIAGLLSYILFAIDPNDYKPEIEQAARKQGIELQMEGELAWSLFPNFGLTIGKTKLASDQHQIRPSMLESVGLSVAWQPLLQKQVVINALTVDGADIHLSQLAQAAAVAGAPAATDEPGTEAGSPVALAVNKLTLSNSKLTLHNEDDTTTVFDNIHLTSLGLSTHGEPSPISLSFQYPLDDETLSIDAAGNVAYSQTTERLDFSNLTISIQNLLKQKLSLDLSGNADLKADTAMLQIVRAGTADLSIAGRIDIAGLTDEPQAKGQLTVESQNLKQALAASTGNSIATADTNALKQLHLQTAFSGSADEVTLKDLQLKLDNTTITGEGKLTLAGTKELRLNLTGDTINVDRYQSPAAESGGEIQDTPSGDEALLAPIAGIVALLDGGKATFRLAFDKLTLMETELSNPEATINANGKALNLSPVTLGVYDGLVTASLKLDLAAQPTAVSYNLAVSNLDIGLAQRQWTENTDLSGLLTMNIEGKTQGKTTDDLLNGMAAGGDLAMKDLHLASVNVEQSYCELAQLIERNPPREAPWPKGTDLDALASQFTVEGQTIHLQNYVTGVGNLKVRGKGTIELDKQTFDVDVIANLQGDRTSENGCVVKSKRIRDRDMPLRCKDSFAEAGATSCKPDSDFVKSMLKGEVLDKLLKPGENGEEKPLEGLLKGLFNR